MCLASHNNHPTSLASSWDISFLKSLVQQDPKGSNKVAHLFILDVYVSPNRKYVNLSLIYYILDFSFFMSQDDAYFHIHQNDPGIPFFFANDNHDNATPPMTLLSHIFGDCYLICMKSLAVSHSLHCESQLQVTQSGFRLI